MTIGQRISTLRKEKNIPQTELAQLLDVSRQAVSKWENDQTSPDTIKLIRLAEVLDTEVEYLVTGRKPVYEPAPVVVNLVETVERVQEKVVVKEVVRHVRRKPVRRNPIDYYLIGGLGFVLGLLLGLAF